MANGAHITAKPLETGRIFFSWFCTDAIDDPLTKHQMLARRIFRFFYAILCTVLIVIFNAFLFLNYKSMMNDTNELFFGLFQMDSTLESLACVFAIFISGRKLASLFRNLDQIYNACKNLLFKPPIDFNWFLLSIQIPDPDERLAKTNEKCERFYGIFMNFLTNWSIKALVFMSVASILICQLKYGLGEIRTEPLYHSMRIVWVFDLTLFTTGDCNTRSFCNFIFRIACHGIKNHLWDTLVKFL